MHVAIVAGAKGSKVFALAADDSEDFNDSVTSITKECTHIARALAFSNGIKTIFLSIPLHNDLGVSVYRAAECERSATSVAPRSADARGGRDNARERDAGRENGNRTNERQQPPHNPQFHKYNIYIEKQIIIYVSFPSYSSPSTSFS